MPAPYECCISCLRDDTTTAFALRGEAEWIIVALHKTGMSLEDAEATFLVYCGQHLGRDSGKVPGERGMVTFSLCESCAEKAGVEVDNLSADELPVYGQGGRAWIPRFKRRGRAGWPNVGG